MLGYGFPGMGFGMYPGMGFGMYPGMGFGMYPGMGLGMYPGMGYGGAFAEAGVGYMGWRGHRFLRRRCF